MTKSNKEILIEAKNLISDPQHWCQGSYAKDSTGDSISTLDADAYCRCSYGALGCAAGIDPNGILITMLPAVFSVLDAAAYDMVLKARPENRPISIIDLNDGEEELPGMTPHQAVMAVFDLAIERENA